MPDENKIDLATIDDMGTLNEMYVDYNERLVHAQEQVQLNGANMQAVRTRIAQIRQANQQQEADKAKEENNADVQ